MKKISIGVLVLAAIYVIFAKIDWPGIKTNIEAGIEAGIEEEQSSQVSGEMIGDVDGSEIVKFRDNDITCYVLTGYKMGGISCIRDVEI